MAKLSIITPCYQSEAFITACLENVIQQKYSGVEHLIIDGGSTDGTLQIIESYASRYSHIRFISEPDNGQSDAMNKGIQMARGEYIGFLNADDTYTEETLEYVLNYLNKAQPTFLCGNLNVFDENNKLLYVSKPMRNNFKDIYFSHTYPINPSSYFYKKNIHEKVGFYNEEDHLTMDLDFFLRYINTYKSYTYVDQVFGNFYVGEATKTFQDREAGNMFKRKEAMFKRYWKENPIRMRLYAIIQNFLTMKIDPRDRAIL
jgi:glycosyltransferase involved in cell wall biosynthesis